MKNDARNIIGYREVHATQKRLKKTAVAKRLAAVLKAGDRGRTGNIYLGRVTLYQLSYTHTCETHYRQKPHANAM